MKKIFITILCAAVVMACGCNKEKSENAECAKQKTEQCNKECKKKADCNKNSECKKECDKAACKEKCADCKKECDKAACKEKCADCKKECDKAACKEKCADCKKDAGCIILDTKAFNEKVADLANPEWKYLGDKPAIIDFYADWGGPCKNVAPILDELAKEYAGQLYIYKVNVDNDGELAQAFNISAIPTLIFIPMNGDPQITVGAPGKEEIKNKIAELLK